MKLFLKILAFFLFITNLQGQQRNVEYFVNQAIANSPLLKDYQNQIQSNVLDSMRIRAGLGPQVNVVSNNSYSPVFNGWGHDDAITNGANVSALVSVSKDLLGQKNVNNQYLNLKLQSLSLINSSKISEQDLRKSVIEQYINTFGTWQQYRFNNDLVSLLNKEEQILRKLTEQGTYKQVDYLTFAVTLQQQQWQLSQIQNQYHDNYAVLNYLCGIKDTSCVSLVEPELNASDLPELSSSVFYQQFVIDSLKNITSDKQIDFQYKPKLNVFGEAGYNSSLVYKPEKNFGVTVGLNFSVPIYDGRQRKMQHDKITIAEQTRINYRDFFSKQYNQQINRLHQQLKANAQMLEQANRQIVFTQVLIDANQKLLETGDARVTDYIMAVENYLNAKNALVQNNIEKYLIISQINYWSQKK